MPLLRASACLHQISFSRSLPLLLPRPPLERTDGRTWSQPGFRSLLTSGAFLLKILNTKDTKNTTVKEKNKESKHKGHEVHKG